MNFFEHQARAKRRTLQLVLLMTLAVISLIAVTSVVLIVGMQQLQQEMKIEAGINWQMVPSIAALVLVVVIGASLSKHAQLRAGGKVVAERLGGRLINLEPRGLEEQRLLNVVEEMALASGTAVPQVYVLPDVGINAFAAGLTPQDAVVGVTHGAIMVLNRDELQGVIAHEFSHIYNGDMRLNTRLVAIVHGILVIGLVGNVIASGSSALNSKSGRNQAGTVGLFIGMALVLLGSVGTFFGNRIKGAISREREFLADASAVQFTRNPTGILGALKKIGGYSASSKLDAAHAAEFSHLYFSEGATLSASGGSATHPPLGERIRRIEPSWDGNFPSVALVELPAASGSSDLDFSEVLSSLPSVAPAPAALVFDLPAVQASIATIGAPQQGHLHAAQQTLASLDPRLKDSARSSTGAQALVYGLLLSPIATVRDLQRQQLAGSTDAALRGAVDSLSPALEQLDPGLRLPLLDLVIPALKQLDKDALQVFMDNLRHLIEADDKVELLEWTLLRIVQRNVEGLPAAESKWTLAQCSAELAVLLGALANAGQADPEQARRALTCAWGGLPFERPQATETDLEHLDQALLRLRQLTLEQRPTLLGAMARCIGYDGEVTVAEAELMRAVADLLDCPMPPLLAQAPAPHTAAAPQATA